ncbi:MAG TPA: VWA domain-containing protein [Pyrinomonadaceae bacterium]|jgi:VWFA-related protein
MNRKSCSCFKIIFPLIFVFCFASVFSAQEQNKEKQAIFTVTVVDSNGKPISDLKKENFTIYDEKTPQPISYFKSGDEPASIGILFDTSGSIKNDRNDNNPRFNMAREGLLRFINEANPANEYFFVAFNKKPQLLLDFTQDKDAFFQTLKNLDAVKLRGNTDFYGTVYLGNEKLSQSKYQKRVLLILSDGYDNESNYKLNEVKDALKKSDVTIYAISIVESDLNADFSLSSAFGYRILGEIAEVTGGAAFYVKSFSEVKEAFNSIANLLRSQYRIGFIPDKTMPQKAKDKWRELKITVQEPKNTLTNSKKHIVIVRKGYYSNRINN